MLWTILKIWKAGVKYVRKPYSASRFRAAYDREFRIYERTASGNSPREGRRIGCLSLFQSGVQLAADGTNPYGHKGQGGCIQICRPFLQFWDNETDPAFLLFLQRSLALLGQRFYGRWIGTDPAGVGRSASHWQMADGRHVCAADLWDTDRSVRGTGCFRICRFPL